MSPVIRYRFPPIVTVGFEQGPYMVMRNGIGSNPSTAITGGADGGP